MAVPAAPGAPDESQKPIPISVSVDYTLVTDYVFRGVNFSEYAGEGREKLNHQMGIGVSYDAGKFGTFGVTFWLEWYAEQEQLTPGSNDHLQEVDYVGYWSYPIEAIATTFETGWIAYDFPQLSGDEGCTNEWYVMLSFDDAKLFGTEGNVFSPYVAFYLDVDDFHPGCWMEFGINHDFVLAELGLADCPFLEHVTVTPSFVLGYDHRYLNKATGTGRESSKLGNLQYGLAVSYDLAAALNLPPQVGGISVTGFLTFSDAVRDELIDDELFGWMTVGWSW